MKAYKVWNIHNHEGYQDIVFAESSKEAKKQGSRLDNCSDAEWIDLRVNRVPYLDGMENRTLEEIMYVALQNGWWFELGDKRYYEDDLEEVVADGVVTPVEQS
ncbi:hypothetical protein [Oceanobacillus sp. FSL H7-0719]|uniref:hypothetical protein n=1 Tax=Oceanobacillus sp. FSL H7-0719 TaxID=2954507 RepID=UPI00324FF962